MGPGTLKAFMRTDSPAVPAEPENAKSSLLTCSEPIAAKDLGPSVRLFTIGLQDSGLRHCPALNATPLLKVSVTLNPDVPRAAPLTCKNASTRGFPVTV